VNYGDFQNTCEAVYVRIGEAEDRYGPFASTHEALGVAMEEFDELKAAIYKNDLFGPDGVQNECLDLAAVLIRLAESLDNPKLRDRSVK